MGLKEWGCQILNFFLPRLCVFCGEGVPEGAAVDLCPRCEGDLVWIQSPLCPRCGRPYRSGAGGDHLCGPCQTEPPAFSRARAAVLYQEEGPSGRAIKGLKYSRRLDFLPVMHHWLRQPLCLELVREAEMLIPVPLHPRRLRQRGFNQALLLAQAFPEVRLERELLVRIRHTPPQTGLNPKERRDNVKGAFALRRPEAVAGKKVVLVDDVYTTGATVRECARLLKKAKAQRVEVLTVARVDFE